MDWIEQLQRDLGAPVVDFALANWLLLVAAALGAWWLFGGSLGGRSAATGRSSSPIPMPTAMTETAAATGPPAPQVGRPLAGGLRLRLVAGLAEGLAERRLVPVAHRRQRSRRSA